MIFGASSVVYEDFHFRLHISKTNSTGDQSQMATAVFLILFTWIVSRICLPDVESSGIRNYRRC